MGDYVSAIICQSMLYSSYNVYMYHQFVAYNSGTVTKKGDNKQKGKRNRLNE